VRIAFLNSSIDEFGGVERGILELGERLRNKGHEVLYYTWYYDDEKTDSRFKTQVVKQMSIGFIARPFTNFFHTRIGNVSPNFMGIPISIFTNVPLITKAVLDSRPDFVYIPAGHSLAGFAAGILRTGLVCYYAYFPVILTSESILAKVMRSFEKYTVEHSICFSNSNYLASFIMSNLGAGPVRGLHNGGNVRRFAKVPRKDDGRTLLFFARFSPEKAEGHNFLLSVMTLLSKSDVKLILAGGLRKGLEPYLESLRERIEELDLEGKVMLMTNVREEDVPELYSKATLYVDPNSYDYSMSIVEAQSAGIPALVRREGGQSEPVADGETGYHLSEHPREWADCINTLLGKRKLIRAMGARARVRAKEFTWDRAAERLESALLEFTKRRG